MEPKKDFDYNNFMDFMKSLQQSPHVSFVVKDNNAFYQAHVPMTTDDILDMMDELEDEVPSRPCYTSVEELIQSVKEM